MSVYELGKKKQKTIEEMHFLWQQDRQKQKRNEALHEARLILINAFDWFDRISTQVLNVFFVTNSMETECLPLEWS